MRRNANREIPDPFSLRRKAFAALRELLGRICDRQPLVLYIDDLQWSDADSTSLLEDLLRPPDSPPLLLLSSFRSEDVQSKPFLEALLEKTGNQSCREVLVGALSKSESYTLLHDLLGSSASFSSRSRTQFSVKRAEILSCSNSLLVTL